jgi:hypothetical protein
MALVDELASAYIVVTVEKWDSSKIDGKRGESKRKQGSAKGYTTARRGLITSLQSPHATPTMF